MKSRTVIFALVAALSLTGCEVHTTSQPGIDPVVVNDENFDQVVLQSDRPVLVDVWATWCGPCKDIAPIVRELAAEYEGRAVVAKLDADVGQRTMQKYRIEYVPTLIVFKNGREVSRVVGVTSKSDLAARLDQALRQ